MDAFVTWNREGYEEEFDAEERLEHERDAAVVREFKAAIRNQIGHTWFRMQWEKKDGSRHPLPYHEIPSAWIQLADEICSCHGVKFHSFEEQKALNKERGALKKEWEALDVERRAVAKYAASVNAKEKQGEPSL
jgi:hypothetical protein